MSSLYAVVVSCHLGGPVLIKPTSFADLWVGEPDVVADDPQATTESFLLQSVNPVYGDLVVSPLVDLNAVLIMFTSASGVNADQIVVGGGLKLAATQVQEFYDAPMTRQKAAALVAAGITAAVQSGF